MNDERKLGPNMKSLVIRMTANKAIPPGGGFADGVEFLTTPGKPTQAFREALTLADHFIFLMQSAPDNPYGDDEEAIAGAILAQVEERMQAKRRT